MESIICRRARGLATVYRSIMEKAPNLGNSSTVVFLERKRKKKWIDGKSGRDCYMLYARSLSITWGCDPRYWTWNCFKETSEENIEVAISKVYWLEVKGKFKMSELSPGIVYEILYQVKLTSGASGWELPITLQLSLPGGRVQNRQFSLFEMPRRQWIDLIVGNFKTQLDGETGEVAFKLFEHGRHKKTGLMVKGVILRPKY